MPNWGGGTADGEMGFGGRIMNGDDVQRILVLDLGWLVSQGYVTVDPNNKH